MPSIQRFIDLMYYYCEQVSVGYDWARRWDVWDGGDTDCSALVITCLREAGFETGWASYTGNMSDALCSNGWVRLAPDLSDAQPGDILLNDANHVAAVLWGYGWDATIGQASMGETGDVYGNQPGDQTGWETNTTAIYNYPWDCILRYEGEEEPPPMPEQIPGDAINNAGLQYQAHVQNIGWCEPVHDGQQAGTTGFGMRLEAIAVNPPEGWELEICLHIQNEGWKRYTGIVHGTSIVCGSVGKAQRIEDMIVRVVKRPDGDTRKLWFQVHQENIGWKAWTLEGFASGADGQSARLEAFRMKIE